MAEVSGMRPRGEAIMTQRGQFSDAQYEVLLRPIKPSRVQTTQGNSYLESHDVIAHLSRIFGFSGWDQEIVSLDLIHEEKVKWTPRGSTETKEGYDVAYRCVMRLLIFSLGGQLAKVVEDVSTGAAMHQPHWADAHDLAAKSATSGALKRCARTVGDQFGLGLYDKGSLDPTVKRSIAYDPPVVLSDQRSATPSSQAEGPPAAIEVDSDQGDPPVSASERLADRAESIAGAATKATQAQMKKIYPLLGKCGIEDRHQYATELLSHPVTSFTELSKADAHRIIEDLTQREQWRVREGEEPFDALPVS
jgi:hypothetical protein